MRIVSGGTRPRPTATRGGVHWRRSVERWAGSDRDALPVTRAMRSSPVLLLWLTPALGPVWPSGAPRARVRTGQASGVEALDFFTSANVIASHRRGRVSRARRKLP